MYSEMLPRLSAEERMDQVSATAAGSGTMKDNDRREFMDSLKRAAHRPGLVKKATKADLASLGIRVEETDV